MTMYEDIEALCNQTAVLKSSAPSIGKRVSEPVVAQMVISALVNHMGWPKDGWKFETFEANHTSENWYVFHKEKVETAIAMTTKSDVTIRVSVFVKEAPMGAEHGSYHVETMGSSAVLPIYDTSALASFVAEVASKVRKSFLETAFGR